MKRFLLGALLTAWGLGAQAQTTSIGGTTTSLGGLGHVVTATAASNKVVLGRPGNLYSVGVTVGGAAGFLLVYDALTAPADGTVTPVLCVAAPANTTTQYRWAPGPALRVTTGAVVVFSTGANCFSQTAATAFLWGSGM